MACGAQRICERSRLRGMPAGDARTGGNQRDLQIRISGTRVELLGLDPPSVPSEALPEAGVAGHEQAECEYIVRVARSQKMAASGNGKGIVSVCGENLPIMRKGQVQRRPRDVCAALAFRKGKEIRTLTADCFDLLTAVAKHALGGGVAERAE